MHYSLTVLPNGLRVISQDMPEIRSLAVGCWIDTGSRDEMEPEAGCAHFLEHLLFKGSERLSAREIAERFDEVGGRSNAFTGKEQTCYWARLRDADLPVGLDILAEMLQRPAFREGEIESERQVVLEEINMTEDDPSEVAHEEFTQALWAGHDLERPVLGTKESITGMSEREIRSFWGRTYHARSTVLAVAGRVDHERLVEMADKYFGGWDGPGVDHRFRHPTVESRIRVRRRDTEQSHLVLGGEGLARGDERRFAVSLLNHILGGGMSSRLFREIREDRGLAYSVYSFRSPHADSGAYGVYAGTTPRQTDLVLTLINEELDRLVAEGVTGEELRRAKSHVEGNIALSMEDANSRMSRLGRDEVSGVEHLSVDETLQRFEAVGPEDVQSAAAALFDGPRVLGAVGPFEASDLEKHLR